MLDRYRCRTSCKKTKEPYYTKIDLHKYVVIEWEGGIVRETKGWKTLLQRDRSHRRESDRDEETLTG